MQIAFSVRRYPWAAADNNGANVRLMPDQPDLLFLIHVIARQLRVEADRRAGLHGLTRAQWVILFWLDRQPGLSQKELADILELEPITVARMLDRLAARGMIERQGDPRDRRIRRISLLPPARPLVEAMELDHTDMLRLATQKMDPTLVAQTQEGLHRLKDAFEAGFRRQSPRPVEPVRDVA